MISSRELDAFVALSDELGGPGTPKCVEYWGGVEFKLDTVVDQDLDATTEAYVDQQLAVYRELSGRDFDQEVNEHTDLDLDVHIGATNPYDHPSPAVFSQHVERISRAIATAEPPRGGKMLDMGCGWGLSAEVAAYSGLSVTAVDVNQTFVDLVNGRAERLGTDITAYQGTFDDFESDQKFDMILFYECLHHALRPWTVLERMAGMLTPNGKIVLAGEPINDTWWKKWGLRLDPESVYCIRKFGWFESGWSMRFIRRSFREAGLHPRLVSSSGAGVGPVLVGQVHPLEVLSAQDVEATWPCEGWVEASDYLVSGPESSVAVSFPEGSKRVDFNLQNFRGKPLVVEARVGGEVRGKVELRGGPGSLSLDRAVVDGPVVFSTEVWNPAEELGSTDTRWIGFHLESVAFV